MATKPATPPHQHQPLHNDKEWMQQAAAEGKTPRVISKELHISYKLVERKFTEYGIPFTKTEEL